MTPAVLVVDRPARVRLRGGTLLQYASALLARQPHRLSTHVSQLKWEAAHLMHSLNSQWQQWSCSKCWNAIISWCIVNPWTYSPFVQRLDCNLNVNIQIEDPHLPLLMIPTLSTIKTSTSQVANYQLHALYHALFLTVDLTVFILDRLLIFPWQYVRCLAPCKLLRNLTKLYFFFPLSWIFFFKLESWLPFNVQDTCREGLVLGTGVGIYTRSCWYCYLQTFPQDPAKPHACTCTT